MKKYILILLACSTISSKAQLTVDSQGNVGVGTSSSSLSKVSVNCNGYSDSEMTVLGQNTGIRAIHQGSGNWGYAVHAQSKPANTNFTVGVRAETSNESPSTSGRSFGVFADAGNATSGWNYAIFGRLSGTNNGAAVYGTISNLENGVNTGGAYAGYFNGATKVAGDLTVTGAIDGIILSTSLPKTALVETYGTYNGNEFSNKLQDLRLSSYFINEDALMLQSENLSDTIADSRILTKIEKQNYERLHYGLNTEQLQAAFPDLVYEREDGSSGVNYIEMIPILVQTINELNNRIKELEIAQGKHSQARSTSSINAINDDPSILNQNSPNPFNTHSSISLTIPNNRNSAILYFYDASGRQIKEQNITSSGKTMVSISASDFAPGMYIYSLVLDGKCVSSKRMIVTK